MNTLQTAGMECAQCANPRLKGIHTCVHGFFDNSFNFQTAGEALDSADKLKELISRQAVEIERIKANDARYRWLGARAKQNTAHDLYGKGGLWTISVHSDDHYKNLYEVIDAAIQKELT